MKKIGILFGQEDTFPQAFVDRVNEKNVKGITAEFLHVEELMQGEGSGYAVIIDRISQDVPFYRSYLKNAALCGTAVINNPFWWSADEKFFNNCLAEHLNVPVPKTVLLPSKDMPTDTSEKSFRNLKFPLDWEKIFKYIGGFPAYMKPHAGGGWKNVYKLESKEDFFKSYGETNQLVMMLQEEIKFDEYFRCYCIGGDQVHIMQYEPRNPHHLRYVIDGEPTSKEMLATVKKQVLALNEGLGYDFNTYEFAVRDGIAYAIDFCNPAPDAELTSVGEKNFEWVVEAAANMAIDRAQRQEEGKDNLTWGSFVRNATVGKAIKQAKASKKAAAKKTSKAKASPKKTTATVAAEAPKVLSAKAKKAAKADLLANIGTASAADKDDLKAIKGVGPKLETILNKLGIFTFVQVSKMKKAEYGLVDALMDAFKGRGERDDWAGQAKQLIKK